MSKYFFNVKRLKGRGIILKAAKHNLRDIQKELGAAGHISAHLMGLNRILDGPSTPEAVAALAVRLKSEAGLNEIKRERKDAVLGLEVVVSIPKGGKIDQGAYFPHCLRWIRRVLGGEVLSAVVHLDEECPHLHVLILPLKDGRMRGSEVYGTKAKIWARHDAFFDDVAASYGLEKPPRPIQDEKAKGKAAAEVIKVLSHVNDPAIHSATWPAVRKNIEANPRPYMELLGMAKPKEAEWQRIMKSKGKGAKVEKAAFINPIGFTPPSEQAPAITH